jgi:hypothetical protein
VKKFALKCLCMSMLASVAFAADEDLVTTAFEPPAPAFVPQGGGGGSSPGLPRLGVGVKVSMLLGIGVEAATSITRKSNVRGGFNFFNYDFTQTKDNTDYTFNLHLRSVQATYDWFPFGGRFHLSPGVLIYNGNKIGGSVSDPPGTNFTLGNTSYTSLPGDPVKGNATIALNNYQVSPMILVGWGNLLKRGGGHFSFNFELGAAFVGSPQTTLSLTGTACTVAPPVICRSAASDPSVLSNIQAEQKKINDAISFLKATPVISFGFGYKIF